MKKLSIFCLLFISTILFSQNISIITSQMQNSNLEMVFDGYHNGGMFGHAVGVGDVNGDGFKDAIVAAHNEINSGKVRIYYGGSSMDNIPDIILNGNGGLFGYSANAGDFNGDGYDDVIVSAWAYNNFQGRVYIYLGSENMDNVADIVIDGQQTGENFGTYVSTAGDINNDGYQDILIGAQQANELNGAGKAFIYLGGASIDNVADVTFNGENNGDRFGYCVSDLGDVNGDGFDDIIVGALYAEPNKTGKAYVFYGGSTMDNQPDVILFGENENDHFSQLSRRGDDLNNDGYDDIIVGAQGNDDNGTNSGKAYVYFGGEIMDNNADITLLGVSEYGGFGRSIASGDINKNGLTDVFISAPENVNDAGSVYVFLDLAFSDNTADIIIWGDSPGDKFGNDIKYTGDINSSGYSDLLIGARNADGSVSNSGRAYLYNFDIPISPSTELTLTDDGSDTKTIAFGLDPLGSDGIDLTLGEEVLPPVPPAGIMDARFILPIDPVEASLKDIRSSLLPAATWKVNFQPGSGGYPITFSWSSSSLPRGTFILKDEITGTIVNVDMETEDTYVLTNSGITSLLIEYQEEKCADVDVLADWNMISVPIACDDMTKAGLFPSSTSNAFSFNGGYVVADNLQNGNGYWLKFGSDETIEICGDEVTGSIQVNEGWNIIGVYHEDIDIDNIIYTPSGIKESNYFGYDNGYKTTDILRVGKGYWIRVNEAGELGFTGSTPLGKKGDKLDQQDEPIIKFDIIAYDGVSDSVKLTFGLDSLATDGYDKLFGEQELPPSPPLGVFEVRIQLPDTLITTYTDIRLLAIDCYEHLLSYQLGDSSEGLTLSWDLPEGVTLNVIDLFGGSVFNESFESGEGSFIITNTNVNNAKLTFCYSDVIVAQHDKNLIPIEYSLSQNYPNPFNPSTRIKFGLPSERKVSLIIFNVLGQEVIHLVNQQLKAGYHEVEFNNSNYSSGIYFYRLQVGDYVDTKKMILLK